MRNPSVKERLAAWAPSVVWAALIFFMSMDSMSSEHTRSWIEPFIRLIVPTLSPSGIELVHEVVRKLAHVGEYFVFFLLLEHSLRRGSSAAPATVPLRALAVAALYSLTDEGHQLFVASRGASLGDCGLDSLGAAAAAVLRRYGVFAAV